MYFGIMRASWFRYDTFKYRIPILCLAFFFFFYIEDTFNHLFYALIPVGADWLGNLRGTVFCRPSESSDIFEPLLL